jgi:hypothetical protein
VTENPTKRPVVLAAVVATLAIAPAASGRTHQDSSTGSLALQAGLAMTSTPTGCPPNPPPGATLCAERTGSGLVRGLGRVSETYMFFVEEQGSSCGTGLKVLETTVRLEIAGKGDLRLALERFPQCIPSALVLTRAFTVTGGSGIYTGASGNGTVHHDAHYTFSGAAGTDTFTGTLTVPGLEFDLTPPTLKGPANKTVHARKGQRRMRVAYKVTAQDGVDGAVPVSCRPRSGSRFKIGRTIVRCSATDRSANTQSARFRVVVKKRR